jgi:DNA-binding PadR family transcriptional regulator
MQAKIDKSLLSGSTAMLILCLLECEDMYGYQMIETLEKQSNNIFTLKAGTLYPLLHGLEKEGTVKSYEMITENARSRKYYSITNSGRKLLRDKKSEWEIYSSALNLVLEGV